MTTKMMFCAACRGGPDAFHQQCDGITRVLGPDRETVITAGSCPCHEAGHRSLRYPTYGDPYSDPPRPVLCRRCGALVGDVAAHDAFHGVWEPFGCLGDVDHDMRSYGIHSNSATSTERTECSRCRVVRTITHDVRTLEVISEEVVR